MKNLTRHLWLAVALLLMVPPAWADLNDWQVMPPEAPALLEGGLPELEELMELARLRDETLARVIKAVTASETDE